MNIKTTFALLAALAGSLCTAQDYHPLLETDKTWLEAYYVGANICLYDQVYQLRIGEDTLINEQVYQKVMRRNFDAEDGSPYCPPFAAQQFEFEVTVAYLREDAAEKKVYLRVDEVGNEEFEEILLYDFNLQVGDTIEPSSYLTDPWATATPYTVTSVDEVTLQNGESRLRISFSDGDQESSYTEGIGGENGLYQPFAEPLSAWNESVCVQQNGTNLFGEQMACAWILSSSEETLKGQSKLYPNPTADRITLELAPQAPAAGNFSFVLNSLDGREVFSAPVTGPVHHFQPRAASGMYIWQLRKDGDAVDAGKLVVE